MKPMKNTLLSLILCWIGCAGCVNLQDNVQVARTTETNTAQNITQKCDVKPYVCRTIVATGNASLQNGALARDKASLDAIWSGLTVDSSQTYSKIEGTDRPQVDWTNQQVYIWVVGKVDNSCRKIVPVKVETDCLSIFITASILNYTQNCKPDESYPVFLYLMPKTDLPIEIHWTDDADGDGFSNDSEIKLGTDPLDPKSHP